MDFGISDNLILRDYMDYINYKMSGYKKNIITDYNITIDSHNFKENELKRLKKLIDRKKKELNGHLELLYNNEKLQNQVKDIYNLLPNDIRTELKNLAKDFKYKYMLILNYVRVHRLSLLDNYPFGYGDPMQYYAENSKGEKLYLSNYLGISDDQNVYKVRDKNGNFSVIKWTPEKNNENKIWKEYLKHKLPNPGVKLDYKFLGFECTVLNLLHKIDGCDYIELGCQIINILKYFHRFGCHSDIKPDNIMKDPKENKYYLIDMGGVSTERKKYGYIRECHSPRYTCQDMENDDVNIITYKHDLIELGFTLNLIYCDNNGIFLDKDDYRYILENTPIWKYMSFVEKLDKENRDERNYDKLKELLRRR